MADRLNTNPMSIHNKSKIPPVDRTEFQVEYGQF
jgi:hypothetical protein